MPKNNEIGIGANNSSLNTASAHETSKEVWRDIPGFPFYQASDKGRIRSIERINRGRKFGKILTPQPLYRNKPYWGVAIRRNKKNVRIGIHRLVAMSFLPNPHNLPVVNHKDENPSNNCVENLEWCTQKYNCNYGTRIDRIKANMPQNKAVYQTSLDGVIIAEFPTIQEAARQTGICAGHICDVCKGNREFANGYKWRYVDEILYTSAQEALKSKTEKSKESRKQKFIEKSRRVAQYDLKGNLLKIWRGMREIWEELGYVRPNIINCCNGKTPKAYGYIWKYAD